MIGTIRPPEKVSNTQGGKELFKCSTSGKVTDRATAQKEFDKKKDAEYDRIYTHESKHKNAGGSQAGPIVVNKDANGVATEGHVDIQLPTSVNKANPQQTLQMAKTAYESATAPGDDMSDEDRGVAARAGSIQAQAQTAVSNPNKFQNNAKAFSIGNQLNYSA